MYRHNSHTVLSIIVHTDKYRNKYRNTPFQRKRIGSYFALLITRMLTKVLKLSYLKSFTQNYSYRVLYIFHAFIGSILRPFNFLL